MNQNRNVDETWHYHNLTKHSYWSVRSTPHYLDWANQPSPFKIYPDLEPIPLPRSLVQSKAEALEVVASTGASFTGNRPIDIDRLTSILYYSAGVTRHKTYPGGELYFRAAACAGALYPTEVYAVCGDLEGLQAGVYHFNPGDFSLRCLRHGDFRGALRRASGDESSLASTPVVLVFTAISWRSTWKYRDRAYRYHFWDNGMIVANALSIVAAHELPAKLVMGFVEAGVNKLIGIDGQRELALSLLAVGHSEETVDSNTDQLPEIDFGVVPLSRALVIYPSIPAVHEASSLTSADEVRDWRTAERDCVPHATVGQILALPEAAERTTQLETIESVIQRRGSTRRFARKSMPIGELSEVLQRATRGIPADLPLDKENSMNELYLIVNRVEGLSSGAYFYRTDDHKLELLKSGEFSAKAAYLTLDQDLGGDSSVTIFLMADLNRTLKAYGNRGYRVAQMEAGIIGGKLYLSAYALKRGATGLTFYDDDVTEFFEPHATGKSCMLVMSLGIPGKRPLL